MHDVDHRRAESPVQSGNLAAHLDPELSVEIRQWLIEQKRLRLLDNRAADGDPLALPARQLRGLAIEKMGDLQNVSRPVIRAAISALATL
jgi:hypothetical protein